MKKISILAIACLSLAALSAQAAQSTGKSGSCPFTDNFHISGATLQQLASDGNLAVQQKSPTNFTDTCANNQSANAGNIYLTVNNTAGGSCKLTILDGPYEMNPSITSSACQGGLQFGGMDHAYGTYDYNLKFN